MDALRNQAENGLESGRIGFIQRPGDGGPVGLSLQAQDQHGEAGMPLLCGRRQEPLGGRAR
jgi:hypothetical protein